MIFASKLSHEKHNFSAGPSILPAPVMEKVAAAVQELDGIFIINRNIS